MRRVDVCVDRMGCNTPERALYRNGFKLCGKTVVQQFLQIILLCLIQRNVCQICKAHVCSPLFQEYLHGSALGQSLAVPVDYKKAVRTRKLGNEP